MSNSDPWVRTWAFLLNNLRKAIQHTTSDIKEIQSGLLESGKRERYGRMMSTVHWSHWYEQPFFYHFVKASFAIMPPGKEWLDFVIPSRLMKTVVKLGEGADIEIPDVEPDSVRGRWIVAASFSLWAQIQAYMAYRKSMSDLVKEVRRSGDKAAFMDAVRIDPTVLTCKTFQTRINQAAVVQDWGFFKTLGGVLSKPPKTHEDFEQAFFNGAILLMHKTGQLGKLTQEQSVQLFIRELRLFSESDKTDRERSVWKQVQRRQKELGTKKSRKLSSRP